MNIYLPIISNLIIASILLIGIITGIKNGFKKELVKLIFLAPLAIGCYFLQPVITAELIKIEAISNIFMINATAELAAVGTSLLSSLVLLILFTLSYILSTILMHICTTTKEDRLANRAAKASLKGLTRKETRLLKKEEKQAAKLMRPKKKPASIIFGLLIGLIIATIFGFVIFTPIKYATKGISIIAEAVEKPELTQITTTFDGTMYGAFDKATNATDFIIKR